jgi:hypothetical protein
MGWVIGGLALGFAVVLAVLMRGAGDPSEHRRRRPGE